MRHIFRIALAVAFVFAVSIAGAAIGQAGSSTPTAPASRAPFFEKTPEGKADAADHKERRKARRDWMKGKRHGRFHRMVHSEIKFATEDGFALRIIDVGEVTAVDADAKTVTLKRKDGVSVTVTANDDTKIRNGREKATLADIKVGDRVHTVQVKDDAGTTLKGIHAMTPPTDDAKATKTSA